jgi:flagellar FliL protein
LSGSQIFRLLGTDRSGQSGFGPARIDSSTFQVISLAPIVTNLAGDEGGWIRLEAAVLVEGKRAVPAELTARLVQDTTALLRTLSIRQISGASGFQHLREELMDRMKARSANRVREVMIQSLVIE